MKYGKIIKGNLIIKKGCKDDFSQVERITGYLCIHSSAELSAPQLQSVGGDLCIHSSAELSALQSVGGYLYIHNNAELSAPQLQSVGGDLYIHSSAELSAQNAKFNVEGTRQLSLKFNFECFLKAGFLFADNILAKIIEKKKNVYKIQICGQTKISYCIEVDGIFSHGATLKEAKESLLYKISDRDTSKYQDYTLDTVITFEDAIKMYRCITGACEAGTRHFIENVLKTKKKKYTIKECIELTKGQFNSNVFEEFFMAKA